MTEKRFIANFLKISLPAIGVTFLLLLVLVEAWVRLSWNPLRGTPWFYISSPTRVEQLAPNYSGWFAGVPVHINNLGFRDPRDYALGKNPTTFRILVLGDSVTFGHGVLYETTYPYLLETKLKAWRPEVDWQVWNLGVPGYNTAREFKYLREVGPTYHPDLVVVGFFQNDVLSGGFNRKATWVRVLLSRIKNFLSTHFYSYHFYKKAYHQLSWTLFASDRHRQLLNNLAREEKQPSRVDQVANLEEQKLTSFEPLANRHRMKSQCRAHSNPSLIEKIRRNAGWHSAVEGFQRLHRQGAYYIVFFINIAPNVCAKDDLFYHGPRKLLSEYFLEVLSDGGTPVVSSYEAFYRYRPSQMPLAWSHSPGNANLVKAEVLFEYLKNQVFPRVPLVTTSGT